MSILQPRPSRPHDRWSRLLARVREAHATQVELHERVLLRNSPWLEDLLHWSWDGEDWQLHGRLLPPAGTSPSITRSGWCPGLG
ncbi:hypothetical protein [Nocardioides ungokensis]